MVYAFMNFNSADHPACSQSLINTFVIRCLEINFPNLKFQVYNRSLELSKLWLSSKIDFLSMV